MPIPFLLAGAAIAAGVYGVKKGVDAQDDFELAKSINKKAKARVTRADNNLEKERKKSQKMLEDYGEQKIAAIDVSLAKWKLQFDRFKNVDLSNVKSVDFGGLDISKVSLTVNNMNISLSELGLGGGAAVGSGAIAGFAAYGGVQALALASTGTAISSLSGAAATNATLAWLGGGALGTSTTAFGMAGGTAVLGGVVAGPVLAVGGLLLASKAEAAYDDAKVNEKKSKSYQKQKKAAASATQRIYTAAHDLNILLKQLCSELYLLTLKLTKVLKRESDFKKLLESEKQALANSAILAKLIVGIIECPVVDETGAASESGTELIAMTTEHLSKLENL